MIRNYVENPLRLHVVGCSISTTCLLWYSLHPVFRLSLLGSIGMVVFGWVAFVCLHPAFRLSLFGSISLVVFG
jgi:hypothetical protein